MPRLHFLFVLHRLFIHRNRYIYHLHGYPRGNIFVRSGTQRDVSSWGNILFYHLLKWIRKLERMISLPQRMPKLQLYMWYYRSIFSDIYTLLYMTISYLLTWPQLINFRVQVIPESMSNDSEDSQESDEEPVKLKTVLWCRDDSYGYTRGKYTSKNKLLIYNYCKC